MKASTACSGTQTLATMIPSELFYMTSLAVYAFLLYFAFFVYRRARMHASGRTTALAFFALACYVAPVALSFDLQSIEYHRVMAAIGWIGATFSVALLLQTSVLLEREDMDMSKKAPLTPLQTIMMVIGYGGAFAVGTLGSGIYDPSGGAIFRFNEIAPAAWPACLWTTFETPAGPYYFLFGVYILVVISLILFQLLRLAVLANQAAASEEASLEEITARLESRNKYLWLSVGIVLFAASGEILALLAQHQVIAPESAGQGLLALGALVFGITITRPKSNHAQAEFYRDFYRSVSTVALICVCVVAVTYVAEASEVSRLTLLSLITMAVFFFVNLNRWWKLVDSLFLGPPVTLERARGLSILEDPTLEPPLLKAKMAYDNWSHETQRVFLQLGQGVSRSTIASSELIHVSTVDMHIRRIKGSLETDRLEEVRALGHKLLVHLRMLGDIP